MRKTFLLLLVLVLLLTLSACDPGSYMFDETEISGEIVSVELIDYDNPSQKHFLSWVPDHFDDLVSVDVSNITIIETMNDEEIPNFIQELIQIDFLYLYYAFNSPKDLCIKINYSNGDFELLSCDIENNAFHGYVGKFNSDGEVIDFVGNFASFYDFEDLITTFFEYELN